MVSDGIFIATVMKATVYQQ